MFNWGKIRWRPEQVPIWTRGFTSRSPSSLEISEANVAGRDALRRILK